MNAKSLVAAALAVLGTSAMAFEATEFVDPAPSATAAVAAPQAATGVRVVDLGEATEFADLPATRDRAEVRAEGRAAAHDLAVNPLYVGS